MIKSNGVHCHLSQLHCPAPRIEPYGLVVIFDAVFPVLQLPVQSPAFDPKFFIRGVLLYQFVKLTDATFYFFSHNICPNSSLMFDAAKIIYYIQYILPSC